jgi:hypothetical protein
MNLFVLDTDILTLFQRNHSTGYRVNQERAAVVREFERVAVRVRECGAQTKRLIGGRR